MKVKALINFGDKETYQRYEVGDVLEMDQDRAESAINKGIVEAIETEKKESKPKTAKKEK